MLANVTPTIRQKFFDTHGYFATDLVILEWWNTYFEDAISTSLIAKEYDRATAQRPHELKDTNRGDGGSTSYYDLPKGAKVLGDIMKHKKMEHDIGEAFCALYRLNDNGEYLRNLKKAKYYIDSAIAHAEKETNV